MEDGPVHLIERVDGAGHGPFRKQLFHPVGVARRHRPEQATVVLEETLTRRHPVRVHLHRVQGGVGGGV